MRPGGYLTMLVRDLAAILRAVGVKKLYAELHTLESASYVFLDSVGSMLVAEYMDGCERCSVRADIALAVDVGLGMPALIDRRN